MKERGVRIVLADDHRMVRKAWEILLNERDSFQVVGQAANGAELLQVLQSTRADVVLMDLDMPVMSGFEATEKIQSHFPWIKVIGLTMQKEVGYIKKLFSAGAKGYLTKNASEEELFEAVNQVVAGGRYLSGDVATAISTSFFEQAGEPKHNTTDSLSQREIEVIKLIQQGHTTSQIAEQLFVSSKTVESHRRNIFKKLDVKNVAQLIEKVKGRIL